MLDQVPPVSAILEVGDTENSDIESDNDVAWKREITLRFEPHPDLKGGARKVIELDYGMVNGVAEITTRVCLAYYLERQFGVDAEAPRAKGVRQQVILANRVELDAARKEVGSACEPADGDADE